MTEPPSTPALGEGAAARTPGPEASSSYRQILKSSALVGGASAVSLLLGMVRNKAIAVLLGPAGVGLIGIYSSIVSTAATVAGLGLANSAVREIAAAGDADPSAAVRKARALRRGSWCLGVAGTALCMLLAVPVSAVSFGDRSHTITLILLAPAILFTVVGAAQTAVLQGTRQIRALAGASVLGALGGLAVALPLYWWLRVDGIAPSLVLASLANLLVTGAYARRWLGGHGQATEQPARSDYTQLVRLGLFLMASGLSTVLGGYLVRVLVVRSLGIDAAGFYQAAFALGGSLIGFVLSAMGTDFYPRLAAAAGDNERLTRLVNEQCCVSLLLALPGLVIMIAGAPLWLRILNTPGFDAAVPLLRLMTLGFLGRVISWPLGYILLARGNGIAFLALEVAAVVAQVGFVALGIRWFGLEGTGHAFIASYVVYAVLVVGSVRRLVGFRWRRDNLILAAGVCACCGLAWLAARPLGIVASGIAALVLGAVATAGSIRELRRRTGVNLVAKLTAKLSGKAA
jgi:PST family polysaccharide transporter